MLPSYDTLPSPENCCQVVWRSERLGLPGLPAIPWIDAGRAAAMIYWARSFQPEDSASAVWQDVQVLVQDDSAIEWFQFALALSDSAFPTTACLATHLIKLSDPNWTENLSQLLSAKTPEVPLISVTRPLVRPSPQIFQKRSNRPTAQYSAEDLLRGFASLWEEKKFHILIACGVPLSRVARAFRSHGFRVFSDGTCYQRTCSNITSNWRQLGRRLGNSAVASSLANFPPRRIAKQIR
jgi:hypothetical protein